MRIAGIIIVCLVASSTTEAMADTTVAYMDRLPPVQARYDFPAPVIAHASFQRVGSSPLATAKHFEVPATTRAMCKPLDVRPASAGGDRTGCVLSPYVSSKPLIDESECSCLSNEIYTWQRFPEGLLFPAYLAGEKEARFSMVNLHEEDFGSVIETTLGGRVGLLRYGTCGAIDAQGWQLDMEGAVLSRLESATSELVAADFRGGFLITQRQGATAWKFGYYHLSSHLGDEWLLRNVGYKRRNYVRDSLVLGCRHHLRPDTSIYGEIAVSPGGGGGARPLECQFGFEYNPRAFFGSPYLGANIHLREELDFGGSINVMTGWQWRSAHSGRVLRIGGQYYDGDALQYSFLHQHETLAGLGVWFDY